MKKEFLISYDRADQGWAEWIAWQLEEAGYSTFIRAWDFGAGRNSVVEMQKATSGAERVIAIFSPDYLTSRLGTPEWTSAFGRDPTGEEGLLVPVRVRECDPRGLLPQIIYIDLVGIADPGEAKEKLLREISRGRKKPATEPPFPPTGEASGPPPFPGASAPAPKRRRTQVPRKEGYLFLNVPPMPAYFVGREALVTEMIARLTSGENAALSASGKGGVGKTTMAVAIAHDAEVIEHFTDGILWAGLGLKPDVPGILAAWGSALGIDVSGLAEPGERAQAIRNAIGLRRMLLVVDDAWQKDAALHLKCGGLNCCHLLTTRDDSIARTFAGAAGAERVPELEEDPAFELLRKLAPEACDTDPEAARRLARDVGGLPLALELVGAYLAAPERSLFPELTAEAFAKLADPAQRLELAQQRLGTVSGRKVTLQEAIALSLHELPESAIRAFHTLGAFAPKPETFDLAAAQAVTEADAGVLAVLVSRNLVEQDGGRLAVHQTVSDVARQSMPGDTQERHARYYLRRVETTGDDWRKIEDFYGQIKWAYDALPKEEWALPLVRALKEYQRLRGLWEDARRWLLDGLEIARRQQDRRTLATLLNDIGYSYRRTGQHKKALRYYERALPIQRKVGNRTGEAATLNNIGFVYNRIGEREKALQYHERALLITREVGNRTGEATTLHNIGSVHGNLGQNEKALQYYEHALPIAQEVGDRAQEAATLSNIGLAYHTMNHLDKALQHYEGALRIQTEVGDRTVQATILGNIGGVYDRLGQWEKALQYYERALAIQTEVGDRAGEAVTRFNLAMLHRAQGALEQAVRELRRAVELEELVQHPDLAQDRAMLAKVEEAWREQQEGGSG